MDGHRRQRDETCNDDCKMVRHRISPQRERTGKIAERRPARRAATRGCGYSSIEIRDTDLASNARAMTDVFGPALQAACQHSVLDLDTRRVRRDSVRIRQALLALLENARRHAHPRRTRRIRAITRAVRARPVRAAG